MKRNTLKWQRIGLEVDQIHIKCHFDEIFCRENRNISVNH
uniref:Uncharacterized protein n=1 Tax=Strigamia maritima TaxID=126957 RepID=T1IKI4_STRMM